MSEEILDGPALLRALKRVHPYDSYEGVMSYLSKGMEGFNRLVARRHYAGYVRKERLNEWFILGRWHLDSWGDASTITKEFIPAVEFPKHGLDVPVARVNWEFWELMREYDRIVNPGVMTPWDDPKYKNREYPTSVAWSYGFSVPSKLMFCPVCRQGWILDNCHDVHQTNKSEVVSLEKYVGMTLKDWRRKVLRHRSRKSGTIQRMRRDSFLRNDKYIDLSPNPNYSSLKVNERGWIRKENNVDYNIHVIEHGDEVDITTWTSYHKSCWRKFQADEEKKYFTEIFEAAGFKDIVLEQIENEYCPCEICAPWYVVKIPGTAGSIKIGWRKRVINIEVFNRYSMKGLEKLDALFVDEDVTKGKDNIHAWGKEKCIEYLKKIHFSIYNPLPLFYL